MGTFLKCAFVDVSLPIPALYSAEDIDSNLMVNSTVPDRVEPALATDSNLLTKLYDAMLRLDNAVIDKIWFSWEALAEEAGIADVALTRMGVRRINALSQRSPRPGAANEKFTQKCVLTTDAWRFIRANDRRITPEQKTNVAPQAPAQQVIPTGIEYLDEFLSPDKPEHGFFSPTTESGITLFPIIAIEGGSGLGKSTLSLQIACNIMQNSFNGLPWCCLFYSLEQEPEWIIEHLKSHRYFEEARADKIARDVLSLEEPGNSYYSLQTIANKILLPKLTPRAEGYRNLSPESLFQRRYSELEKSIGWAKTKGICPFYFIDSLSAFAPTPLTRSQIHRLFTLFRAEKIPLLVTLERLKHWAVKEEEIHFDVARYLADIVIKLDEDYKNEYYCQTIEVTKTRYNRRILGKHLLKLKIGAAECDQSFDPRLGIVIYPSDSIIISSSAPALLKRKKGALGLDIAAANCGRLENSSKVGKRSRQASKLCHATDRFGHMHCNYRVIWGHKFAVAMILCYALLSQPGTGQKLIVFLPKKVK